MKSVLPAIHSNKIKAIAHITGGGLIDNIPRIIPESMRARLNAHYWHVHPVRKIILSISVLLFFALNNSCVVGICLASRHRQCRRC